MQSPVTPRYTYPATPLVSNRAYATHRPDGYVKSILRLHIAAYMTERGQLR